MSAPVSFLEALKSRYGTDDVDQYDENAFLVGDVSRKRNKKWELVGMEKARQKQEQYDRLVEVVLKASGITVAVKADEKKPDGAAKDALAEANMVRLRELDLSGNVDLPLAELGTLIGYFPSLTGLQVSDVPNLLTSTIPPQASPLLLSRTLTKLVLNNAGFRSVFQLCALVQAPQLTELHLDNNGLTNFSLFANDDEAQQFLASESLSNDTPVSPQAVLARLCFAHVTTLSLAQNQLTTWGVEDEARAEASAGDAALCVRRGVHCGLGYTLTNAFPAVRRLFLTNNTMPNIDLSPALVAQDVANRVRALETKTEDEQPATVTPTPVPSYLAFLNVLSLLCLNENATLTSPRVVDAIRVLCPVLDTFRITYGNLLPQWNESLSRMYVVASLPTIQLLNRGQVRPKERLDSELFYVQRGMALCAAAASEGEGLSMTTSATTDDPAYPLLDYLRAVHKDTVLSIYKEGSTAGSDGTAHRMLDVTLYFANGYKATTSSTSSSAAASKVERQLPSSLTVGKLKALVKVVFQVDPVTQVLGYRSGDDGVLQEPIELTNESQTLAYYGVSSGSIIVVKDSSLR